MQDEALKRLRVRKRIQEDLDLVPCVELHLQLFCLVQFE